MWVDVKEREPTQSIVWVVGPLSPMAWPAYYYKGKFLRLNCEEFATDITHWMEMDAPEPPKLDPFVWTDSRLWYCGQKVCDVSDMDSWEELAGHLNRVVKKPPVKKYFVWEDGVLMYDGLEIWAPATGLGSRDGRTLERALNELD